MNGTSGLRQRLDARLRLALEPARFPERRDVELAFVAGAGTAPDGGVAFFDHFWIGATSLWAVAARIDIAGLDGGIAAAGLRQLLRALAAELGEPQAALEELRSCWSDGPSAVAAMRLDTATGTLGHATRGTAACSVASRIEPDNVLWLALGREDLPEAPPRATEDLQSLVNRHAGSAGGILAAIQFKAWPKKLTSTTLTVRNDRVDVTDAVAAVRSFLDRQAVAVADADALELVLDELLTNQVNYGYRDGGAHEILLEVGVEDDCLTIQIRDDGLPFDPLSVAEPDLDAGIEERQLGGLGMHFVRTIVDDVTYRRSGGWNVLSLGKRFAVAGEERA